MTENLYRKEALQHRTRSLYGDVVLQSPPKVWFITLLLAGVLIIILGLLFLGRIETESGTLSLLRWLMSETT